MNKTKVLKTWLDIHRSEKGNKTSSRSVAGLAQEKSYPYTQPARGRVNNLGIIIKKFMKAGLHTLAGASL